MLVLTLSLLAKIKAQKRIIVIKKTHLLVLLSWLQTQYKMRKLFLELKQKEIKESVSKQGLRLQKLTQLSLQDSCRYHYAIIHNE